MPTLILTRHAKSDWGRAGLDDYDRPLNARGDRSARALGTWMAEERLAPSHAIHSGARRTAETWKGIAAAFPSAPDAETNRALYHAEPETILRVLEGQTAERVLLIGHNPGIGDFAQRIVRRAPDHLRFYDYPTGATAVIEFDVDWPDVTWGTGEVAAFVVPRDLPGVSDRGSG